MKYLILAFVFVLAACNQAQETSTADDKNTSPDTTLLPPNFTGQQESLEHPEQTSPETKVYANERFKDVTVEKTGEHVFQVQGKAQIFEASFNWVVEDGHKELKKGHEMTDAGAPEWGNFKFTVDVQKERDNSTLMLILFESSPKDGSRQYELPVLLY